MFVCDVCACVPGNESEANLRIDMIINAPGTPNASE